VFSALNVQPPNLYLQARENKPFSAFLVFMIGNQVSGGLCTTGAFEITYGHLAERCIQGNRVVCADLVGEETMVFSKLSEHRFPELSELIERLDALGVV